MSCESETCDTNVKSTHADSCGTQTPCCSNDCGCPIEKAIHMWQGAFCQALNAVQVELLKERIKKTWGPLMEKEADAIIQAMGAQWHAKLSAAKAQCDLRDTVRKIIESAKN